jgi:acetylornithine deacetylase
MKGSLVAALHAVAAIRRAGVTPPREIVLQAVSSEEDGGLGTFAALQRDAAFDACLIVEPTELDVVCAQAGALTFRGVVEGRSAHAAMRLEGCSAIDRYLRIHTALTELEVEMNRRVEHPLMSPLDLPYPLVVGRLAAGAWPSQVPDQLVFEGRVGVPIGAEPASVRGRVERAVRLASDDGESPVRLSWTGGQLAPAETPPDHPFAELVRTAVSAERGEEAAFRGVPWGADMRLFAARGIPTVMCGPRGFARAHAVDEWVAVSDLVLLARAIVRIALAPPGD